MFRSNLSVNLLEPQYTLSMKIWIGVLGLTFGATLAAAYGCQSDSQADLIATGHAQFVNNYHDKRESCYTVYADFLDGYRRGQAVAAPASIDDFSCNDGVDFSIQVGFKDRGKAVSIVLLASGVSAWRKVVVSYLIHARDDFWVGAYSGSSFPFLGCWKKEQRSAAIYSTIDGLKFQQDVKAIVFVSALRTESKSFHLALSDASVNSTSGQIQVQVSTDASLQIIQISYIAYSAHVPFTITIHKYQEFNLVKKASYNFIGLDQVNRFEAGYLGLAINSQSLSCLGTGCPNACIDAHLCKKLGGSLFDNVCLICKEGEVLVGKQCKKPCKEYEIFVNGQCQCQDGYISVNGWCRRRCASNSYYEGRKCQCLPGYNYIFGKCVKEDHCDVTCQVWDGKQCVCKPGFYKNHYGKCIAVPTCKDNQIFNGKTCVCKPLYQRNNLGVCVPPTQCDPNQILNQYNVCICKQGFVRNAKGICQQKCEQYAYWWGNKCECLSGYYRSEPWAKCKPIPKCGKNQVLLNYQCVCAEGKARVNGYCVDCGPNQVIENGQCVCKPWYIRVRGVCTYQNPCGQYEQSVNGKCVCKSGYKKYYDKCVPVCPVGQIWTPRGCQCKNDNDIKIDGACTACPSYSRPNNAKDKCECYPGYVYEPKWNKCYPDPRCPPYSRIQFTPTGPKCICHSGYISVNGRCDKCETNSHPNADQTACICDTGYEWEPLWKKCMQVSRPSCPDRSAWNQNTLRCECKAYNEHLIDNQCRQCGHYESWNGKQCVCQTGYFKINGACRTCDPHTSYNGKQCICNHGYYGTWNKCEKCHESCGKCSGPAHNQCLTCSDVSYSLKGGKCLRGLPCPDGLYFDNSTNECKPCSSYCAICQNEQICSRCIDGFKRETISSYGVSASFCVEECGDGKRFQLACDDGNKWNNDGCNSDCQVEKGWTCQGGSSVRPSTCVEFTPDRSFINPTGAVHLFGRVVQGVRLTHIPKDMLTNQCSQCSKILWIKVTKCSVVPGVRVSYVPKSKYQFYVEFEFHGIFSIPVFEFTIQINPNYKQYFSSADMAAVKHMTVDPAVLASADDSNDSGSNSLSLDEISVPDDMKDILDGKK